jgi:hypothetical protein
MPDMLLGVKCATVASIMHRMLLRHHLHECMQTYPSSRKQVVDWNKLEHDLKEEEKTEVLDGEAGAQKLFRTIYAGTFSRAPPLWLRGALVTPVLGGRKPAGPWCSRPACEFVCRCPQLMVCAMSVRRCG